MNVCKECVVERESERQEVMVNTSEEEKKGKH